MTEQDERPGPEAPSFLARLASLRPRRAVPFVEQLTATDCGPACLVMVAGLHGKELRLDAVRDLCGSARDGTTAQGLVEAGGRLGLRGRGVRVDLEELVYLDPGAILHWEFNHYVVFERLGRGWVDLVDPSLGRRRLSLEAFGKSFTGVALLFEPSEEFVAGGSRDRPVLRMLRGLFAERAHWARIVVMSLLLQLFALSLPLLTGAVVDRVVPSGDRDLLVLLGGGMLVVVAFHFLASMVRAHLLLHLRTWLDARMTLGFLDHLLRLPLEYFQRRPAGDLNMRMTSNSTLRDMLTSSALSGLLDGALVFLYLALLVAVSPRMAAVVVGLGGLQVLVYRALRRRQRELTAASLAAQAKTQSYQFELLTGLETLKSMGSEARAADTWTQLYHDALNASLDRGRLDALSASLQDALRLASPLAVLGFGAWQVLAGNLSLGSMLAMSALAAGFLGPLGGLVSTAMTLQSMRSYVERIEDVLRAAPEQDPAKVRPAPALTGAVRLEGVSFRYADAAPLVVRDVSVEVAAGQFVAIVGRSGSGKSTLASLMAALYRPTAGRILYDEQDLEALEARSLRGQLGIVVQRPYLFGTSIRANIALSDPALGPAAIAEAARLACVADEIDAMPMGYETVLVDGGTSLSGGQRQRLALARALVRRPKILLLDEATSALDVVTEHAVQENLQALGCTRIVIAHRLSTVARADLILVMEQGAIVQRGTHAELAAQPGPYRELLSVQNEGADGAARDTGA